MNYSHIGLLIKEIRLNKNFTQEYVSKNIMSQSSYSKFEKGETDIGSTKLIYILEKLQINYYEFQEMIKTEQRVLKIYKKFSEIRYNNATQLKEILREALALNACIDNIALEDLINISKALIIINEKNDIILARKYGINVWENLKKHDKWYYNEICLINAILFIFPLETAVYISEKAIDSLKKSELKEAEELSLNIQANLILLYIKKRELLIAHKSLDILIEECKNKKMFMQLAVCYSRKGIVLRLLKKRGWLECCGEALKLLEALGLDSLKRDVVEEVYFYFEE